MIMITTKTLFSYFGAYKSQLRSESPDFVFTSSSYNSDQSKPSRLNLLVSKWEMVMNKTFEERRITVYSTSYQYC